VVFRKRVDWVRLAPVLNGEFRRTLELTGIQSEFKRAHSS